LIIDEIEDGKIEDRRWKIDEMEDGKIGKLPILCVIL
jgi:hypothetical protein